MKHQLLLLLVLLILCSPALAQPSLPGGPSQAPVDGGLLALLAAGIWYGIQKLTRQDKDIKFD